MEFCTPQLLKCFQLFHEFSLTLVGPLFEFLKDFKRKRLSSQLLPILLQLRMNSGARRHRELKVVLHAFQVRGMAYEELPIQRIGYRVDAAVELAFLGSIDDFFLSVHFAHTPYIVAIASERNRASETFHSMRNYFTNSFASPGRAAKA